MLFISTPSGQQSLFNQLCFDECDYIHNLLLPVQEHKKLNVNKDPKKWAIDIAYQLWHANSNHQYNIHQWHIDILNEYILSNIDYGYISKFARNKGIETYNIKIISDANEFCEIYNKDKKSAYDLADLIVLDINIRKELLKNISHDWITDYLIPKNILNNKTIYEDPIIKIYFNDGSIFLESKKSNDIWSCIIRYEQGKIKLGSENES